MYSTRTIHDLLDIKEIYLEPAVREYKRGREILTRFPDAELIEVPSHWKIPSLHGFQGAVENWLQIKRNVLILGVKKSLSCRVNNRSSNFVSPSESNGCTMSCSYCYVPRRKGYANPITLFVNIEQIMGYLERHAQRQGPKTNADHVDPAYWVYEIGENGDCSADAALCDNVKDLINLFKRIPNAKLTFATKFVNRDMLAYDPQGKTRVRFSLMPHRVSKLVDVRTTPVSGRIDAINDYTAAGYEVNVNFSPVIYYKGWEADWLELFTELDDKLDARTKDGLACEIIFLTHNEQLHDVNMGWHPKGEEILWTPALQEVKYSETGGRNVRYKRGFKGDLVKKLVDMVHDRLPYCTIRYAF